MAQRFKDEAGNIWEIGPDGQPSLVSHAGGANPLQSPLLAPQVQKATNEATASQYAPQTARADATIKTADAGVAGTVANAEAQKAVADAQKAQAELAKLKLEQTQTDPKSGAYKALQEQIDHVSELYRQNIQGGMPNPIWGHLPTSGNSAFTSASQGLVNPYMQAFRVPGVGSQSDTELRQFIEGNVPQPTDTDAQIQEKIGNLQRQLDSRVPQQGITQSAALPPIQGPQGDNIGLAQGQSRAEIDPVLKAVGTKVGVMLSNGTPRTQIEAFLKKSGVDPSSTDLDAKVKYRATPEFKKWQRANPGAPYPIDPSFYTKQVPMSDTRSLMNQVSQSAPGAFAAASANAITGGRLDNLSSNPELAQTGMELLRSQHPLASFGGDLAGQASVEALAGTVPGAQGLMASRWGRRGADALYGAYSGSGEDNGDPIGGALTGAATNAGFGMFGRGAQRAAGGALSGVKNSALQYLDNRGVPLTVGQIGNGSNSVIGKALGGLEDRAAGLPGFDSIINSARRRGEQGFNSAAFREAGGSGITGAPGVEELSNKVNNAYSFLDPVSLPLDAQFAGTQAGVRAGLPALPKYGQEIGTGLNAIDSAAKGGSLTGRDWQQALRTVKSDRASLAGKEFSQGGIDALGNVEDNLLGLANRQSPQSLQTDLASANGLNKQFRTITAALDKGPSQARGELFSSTALDTAARASQRKFGGQVSSITGHRPFYDLTKAGMDVMPNQVPDSGTAGRALLYSALFGGGAGIGFMGADDGEGAKGGASGAVKGLALSAALAAPYSKTGQRLIQKALLGDRPDRVIKIGDYLINKARLGGMFGSAFGRDYVYQPELPQ